MKSVMQLGQMSLRYGIILILAVIIITGIYYLYNNQSISDSILSNQRALSKQKTVLMKQKGSIQMPWLRTLSPLVRETEGNGVWNNAVQQGVMSFYYLPRTKSNQSYHLWIYDLESSGNEPISAAKFKIKGKVQEEWLIAVVPEKKIQKPYKFMLTLDEKEGMSVVDAQSLLLAQP